MTLVIVILAMVLTLAYFYLKCSMMQSFLMLWSAILATIITFSYYEWTAEFLISRGMGLNWAQCGCFIALFVTALATLRTAMDSLSKTPIEIGDMVKIPVSLACGLLTGIIISGNLLVALGLLPMHGKVFYSQFSPDKAVMLTNPNRPALSTDGFVVGLYNWVSAGSLASGNSFGNSHADYLSQIHLNKLKVKDEVLSVSSRESLTLPKGKDKKPIRWAKIEDDQIVIVRAGIEVKAIDKGGAGMSLKFFPAQVRLIINEEKKAKALYPEGFWKNGKLIKAELNEIIIPDSKAIKKGVYWMDIAFRCPADKKPTLLQFKQNAMIDLASCEVVENTPKIEQALESGGQEEASS